MKVAIEVTQLKTDAEHAHVILCKSVECHGDRCFVLSMSQVNDQTVSLSLLDTAGQEEYDRLRTMVYSNAHVVIVCFAVDDRNSYTNVRSKWLPEIGQFCPSVSIILVATKIDLRGRSAPGAANDSTIVTSAEGRDLANDIKAAAYVECSSRRKQGLDEVFEAAAKAATKTEPRNSKKEKKRKSGDYKDDRCTVS